MTIDQSLAELVTKYCDKNILVEAKLAYPHDVKWNEILSAHKTHTLYTELTLPLIYSYFPEIHFIKMFSITFNQCISLQLNIL